MTQALDVNEVLIYAMGLEPWLTFIFGIGGGGDSLPLQESRLFIELCLQQYIPARRLYGRDSSEEQDAAITLTL